MDKFPNWADHIIACLFCFAIPIYAALKRKKGVVNSFFTSSEKKNIYISGSFSLFLMGMIVAIEWLFSKRPLAELGLTQPANFNAWWWIAGGFIIIYAADAFTTVASKKGLENAKDNWKKRTPFLPTKNSELPEYVLLCFSAGVFEELIYRGFLVTYTWFLFDGVEYRELLAVVLPAFVFSVAHFYQGSKAVLKIFILSLFFGYLFILSGSLLVVMILHFLVDLVGGLLTIKYIQPREESVTPEVINNDNG